MQAKPERKVNNRIFRAGRLQLKNSSVHFARNKVTLRKFTARISIE